MSKITLQLDPKFQEIHKFSLKPLLLTRALRSPTFLLGGFFLLPCYTNGAGSALSCPICHCPGVQVGPGHPLLVLRHLRSRSRIDSQSHLSSRYLSTAGQNQRSPKQSTLGPAEVSDAVTLQVIDYRGKKLQKLMRVQCCYWLTDP
jgi:hypothetical protein